MRGNARLLAVALPTLVLAFAARGAVGVDPQRSLRIVSNQPLPPALVKAVDVRWAGEASVYLSLLRDGTVEAALDSAHPRVVPMIPKMGEPGGSFSFSLAASSEYLVTNGPLWISWKAIGDAARGEAAFDSIHDFDVMKDRFLILAARRDKKGRFAPEGAIAWLGSLSRGLADLRPVAYDATGAGARNLGACSAFQIGGVRFFRDGSFVVVPGVQPGIHHYGSQGNLIHSWDSAVAGLDADCGSLSAEQVRKYAAEFLPRTAWLNQRRTLDEILPLPQGPGLVVRSISQGQARWDLRVLTWGGGATEYRVPVQGQSELSHLKGDVRGNKIVFVLSAFKRDGMSTEVPRLVIAEL